MCEGVCLCVFIHVECISHLSWPVRHSSMSVCVCQDVCEGVCVCQDVIVGVCVYQGVGLYVCFVGRIIVRGMVR